MSLLRGVVVGSVSLLVASACSGSDDDGQFNSGSGVGGTANYEYTPSGVTGTSAGTGTGTSGTPISNPVDGCASQPDDTGCVGRQFEGENITLDIFVMFDLSCSMSCNVDESGCCHANTSPPDPDWRIQPVREAMRTFLQDPLSSGIGVGLGFFGDHDVNNPDDPAVCNIEAHSDATVEIAPLPDNAPALIAALDAGVPQGGTPTHFAIGGACVHADGWHQSHPDHKVVILLVTDGIPEHSCNANIQLATAAAEDCYDGGNGYQTYVLGVVANNNNSLQQLNGIADAGGTDQAYLTDSNDIAGSVLEALNAIRADAVIPCTLTLPEPTDGTVLDTNYVNVGICDSGGNNVPTFYVPSAQDCSGAGSWYYTDTATGQAIQLCDATCETVSNAGSQLFFSVGCATQEGPVE